MAPIQRPINSSTPATSTSTVVRSTAGAPGETAWAATCGESLKLGMIPQFVYYNIPDGGESFTTNNEHLASTEYMEGYFNDLKYALDTIASEGGDELVQFIMEPDFIGYLMQNANAPASQLSAMTSAAYSSGVLEAGVDPQFENNRYRFNQCH